MFDFNKKPKKPKGTKRVKVDFDQEKIDTPDVDIDIEEVKKAKKVVKRKRQKPGRKLF